jgi:PGF-pre-PGF domain-containing protein
MDANGCGTEVNKSMTVQSCATNPSGGPSGFYPPLPAQNGTNPTSTNTTWYFERIRAGVETGLVLDQPGYAVTQLLITLEKDAGGVYVDVKKLGAAPSTLAKLPDGNVYQYLNITIMNLSSSVIQQGRIRFEVSKAWIASNSINESTVALERYMRGEWQKLNTSIIDSTLNYSFFASETPGFSIFAITGRVLEAPESICTPGEKRCFNDTTEECCDNGIDWLLRERCAYSCSNGKCLENPYESGLMQNYLWLLVPIALVAIATIGAIFKIKRHPKIGA